VGPRPHPILKTSKQENVHLSDNHSESPAQRDLYRPDDTLALGRGYDMSGPRTPERGVQQIRLDAPQGPDMLASRIMKGVRAKFVEYDHHPSQSHFDGLEQIAIAIQMMADGDPRLPKTFILSSLPTGMGKTTVMVEGVKAILGDPARAHVGIVIFVNQLDQIRTLIEKMGLTNEQFAVRTGKDNKDLNELGLTSLMTTKKDKKAAHRHAQVLFTTQQKFLHVARYQGNFARSPFFQYGDVTRQVRIWDEAILPAEPVVLTVKEIKEYVRRLKGWDQVKAATVLSEWLKGLADIPSDNTTEVPLFWWQMTFPPEPSEDDDDDDENDDRSKRDEDLYDSDLARIMLSIAGQTVGVHQDIHSGTTAISYRESLPRLFAPLLILDASGELRMTYEAWGEGRGNLRELPSPGKTYRNLTTHYWDHAAGKTAHRNNKTLEELAGGVADAVAQVPKECPVLIIHRLHQKPYADMESRIKAKVQATGGDAGRLRFLTWGRHTATNEYQDIKHVIVAGLLQYGDPEYQALWRAAGRVPVEVPALKDEIEKLRLGEIKHNLFQAVGRGAVRHAIEGDVPEGCHLWVVFSAWATGKGGVPPSILTETFPGTKLCRWQPIPEKLRRGAEQIVTTSVEALGEQAEATVCLRDLGDQAGLGWTETQRQLREQKVLRELCRRGITVEGPRPISPKGVVVLRRGCQQEKCGEVQVPVAA
jgi:hypothetical protein